MYKRFRDKWAAQEKRKANATKPPQEEAVDEAAKSERKTKRSSRAYVMDKIGDKTLFRAVSFAIQLARNGESFDAANCIAARYYGVDVSDVAHYVGQRAQRLGASRKGDGKIIDCFAKKKKTYNYVEQKF